MIVSFGGLISDDAVTEWDTFVPQGINAVSKGQTVDRKNGNLEVREQFEVPDSASVVMHFTKTVRGEDGKSVTTEEGPKKPPNGYTSLKKFFGYKVLNAYKKTNKIANNWFTKIK